MQPEKLYRLVTQGFRKSFILSTTSPKKVVGFTVTHTLINAAVGTPAYTATLSYTVPAGYAYIGYSIKKTVAFASPSSADYIPSIGTLAVAADDSFSTYAVNGERFALESNVLGTNVPEGTTITFNLSLTKEGGGNIPGDLTAGKFIVYVVLLKTN